MQCVGLVLKFVAAVASSPQRSTIQGRTTHLMLCHHKKAPAVVAYVPEAVVYSVKTTVEFCKEDEFQIYLSLRNYRPSFLF